MAATLAPRTRGLCDGSDTAASRPDDDLTAIGGRRDQLEGKIQERYGLPRTKLGGKSTTGIDRRL
jgi:hypothetical protein